jgi:hypothetical protein
MAEEKFSPEQSLQLIQSMISKTKQSMSDNSIYFLVWGWLTFIACIGQFVLKHIYDYEKHYMVWLLLVIGIVFTVYQGIKDEKKVTARTYVDESMKNLWMGMGICFVVQAAMVFFNLSLGVTILPFYIMLYGLGTFISGNIIRFRPMIIGGIMAWALAIGATRANYDYQLLFAAAALLFSYIIPAYLLRYKRQSSKD